MTRSVFRLPSRPESRSLACASGCQLPLSLLGHIVEDFMFRPRRTRPPKNEHQNEASREAAGALTTTHKVRRTGWKEDCKKTLARGRSRTLTGRNSTLGLVGRSQHDNRAMLAPHTHDNNSTKTQSTRLWRTFVRRKEERSNDGRDLYAIASLKAYVTMLAQRRRPVSDAALCSRPPVRVREVGVVSWPFWAEA